jgi:hypothetical protein
MPIPALDESRLKLHRRRTFHLPPARPLASPRQALHFVDSRGFVFFWPIKGVDLPSLWTAVAGDRPVADKHDDPGHITWGWKDDSLPKRMWYYAKVLRRKATLISLKTASYFYALSENYGSIEEDHLMAYERGHLTLAARNIYEALLGYGPLDSISLRKAARLSGERESQWNRALEILQADFKILPVAVAEAGAWRYAFVYDIVARHFPELPHQARAISESGSRKQLVRLYVESVGAARERDVLRLFGWPSELVSRAVDALVQDGVLQLALRRRQPGEWLALPRLCRKR